MYDRSLVELHSLLPDDLDDVRVASPNNATGKPDTMAFINPRTHELQGVVGAEHGALLADRNLLRRVLMKHLNVQHNKHLAHYEHNDNGVRAHFKDGTSARGTMLIGADGSNSRVRHKLLDGFEATPSRAIILNGEVVLSKHDFDPILEHATVGILYGEPNFKGTLLLSEWLKDGNALFNWNVAWLSDNLDVDLAWAQTASSDALFGKAKELAAQLPSYIREAIQRTGPSGMAKPPIKLVETVLPTDKLPAGQVTLMGDSAHSMVNFDEHSMSNLRRTCTNHQQVPFRGMGANTALLDACDLAKAILGGLKEESYIEHVLRSYEADMIPRGRQKVLESREIAESQESFDVSGGRLGQFKS